MLIEIKFCGFETRRYVAVLLNDANNGKWSSLEVGDGFMKMRVDRCAITRSKTGASQTIHRPKRFAILFSVELLIASEDTQTMKNTGSLPPMKVVGESRKRIMCKWVPLTIYETGFRFIV
jgi:hypothetical protein